MSHFHPKRQGPKVPRERRVYFVITKSLGNRGTHAWGAPSIHLTVGRRMIPFFRFATAMKPSPSHPLQSPRLITGPDAPQHVVTCDAHPNRQPPTFLSAALRETKTAVRKKKAVGEKKKPRGGEVAHPRPGSLRHVLLYSQIRDVPPFFSQLSFSADCSIRCTVGCPKKVNKSIPIRKKQKSRSVCSSSRAAEHVSQTYNKEKQ